MNVSTLRSRIYRAQKAIGKSQRKYDDDVRDCRRFYLTHFDANRLNRQLDNLADLRAARDAKIWQDYYNAKESLALLNA